MTLRAVAQGPAGFWLMVALSFAVSWGASMVAGGASRLPPHLFYLPIVLMGLRYGLVGALGGAVLATVLAGPALPANVADAVPQMTSDWVGRGAFFFVVGTGTTSLLHATIVADRREFSTAQQEAALRRAIDEDQFAVHYQPLVRIPSGAVVGAEALVRWNHPTRGLLGPDEFIPFAEERGVIDALGDWVLTTVVADLRAWQKSLGNHSLPIQEVSINVSRRQLYANSRLIRRLDELQDRLHLPARLIAEVTESCLADDLDLLVDELNELQRRGVQIAVDDFGTGHSSILALRDQPIDVIKIDKTFVQGLTDDTSDFAIVDNTVNLANQLGKRVIAEGVETEDQRRTLEDMGVSSAQGYLFSPALPIEQFKQWIADTDRIDASTNLVRHQILVVDDKRSEFLYIGLLLQDHAEVSFAATGWDAIAMLAEGSFSVVLMDTQMPEMSGLDTVRAIRTLEHADDHNRRHHVIIGLSARDLPEDEELALAVGMDAYLTKPLNLDRLDQTLQDLGHNPLIHSATARPDNSDPS